MRSAASEVTASVAFRPATRLQPARLASSHSHNASAAVSRRHPNRRRTAHHHRGWRPASSTRRNVHLEGEWQQRLVDDCDVAAGVACQIVRKVVR
jgi:hypothetical protein